MATQPLYKPKYIMPDIFRAAENDDIAELYEALVEGQRLDERKDELLHMTPLHIACIRSSNDFLKVALYDESCDPWIRDDNLRLAFDHAAARNNKEAMTLLYQIMYPSMG
jgi:ankyrin repeat protein